MDPRRASSERRLRAAVYRLACVTPAADLTVKAVATEAGVSRDTFYRFADRPCTLLASHLAALLSAAEDSADGTGTVEVGVRTLVDHVFNHALVYRTALQGSLPPEFREPLEALTARLLQHFQEGVAEVDLRMKHFAIGGTVAILEALLARGLSDRRETASLILHAWRASLQAARA